MRKVCQSCGMPLAKDPQGGGTDRFGKKSDLYCSHCYRQGSFTEPRLTLDQMKAKVNGHLKTMGVPGFLRWLFTWNMPRLQRWKKK